MPESHCLCPGTYPCLTAQVTLKREIGYYITQSLYPHNPHRHPVVGRLLDRPRGRPRQDLRGSAHRCSPSPRSSRGQGRSCPECPTSRSAKVGVLTPCSWLSLFLLFLLPFLLLLFLLLFLQFFLLLFLLLFLFFFLFLLLLFTVLSPFLLLFILLLL